MRLRFEGYRGRYKYVFERNTTKTGEEKTASISERLERQGREEAERQAVGEGRELFCEKLSVFLCTLFPNSKGV